MYNKEYLYSILFLTNRNFYNATFERMDRARGDPCSRQPELKQMWLQLLQRSQDTLRSAAERLVQKYLAETPAENKAQVHSPTSCNYPPLDSSTSKDIFVQMLMRYNISLGTSCVLVLLVQNTSQYNLFVL